MPLPPSPPRRRAARAAPLAVVLAGVLAACDDQGPRRCAIEIPGGGEPLVVAAGASGAVLAETTCERGTVPAIRWSVSDPRVATVDAAGVVTGIAPGEVTLVAEFGGRAPARAERTLIVVPPYLLLFSPPALTLTPRTRTPLSIAVLAHDHTPRGFPRTLVVRSADSCIASLSSDRTVLAGRPGTTDLVVSFAAAPGVVERVPVTVRIPAGAPLTAELVGADAAAVAGRLTLQLAVGNGVLAREGGRIEVRLGGQLAGTLLLSPAANEEGVIRVPFTVDTDARDASGARRFANGPQTLEVALVVADVTMPGCAPYNLGSRVTRPITLANP